MKRHGIDLSAYGCLGTWYVVDISWYRGFYLYELESEMYGDELPHIIMSADGSIFEEDIWNGFSDFFERMED